jgi:NTF2 fold immunity protein of polymorphic toxin system component
MNLRQGCRALVSGSRGFTCTRARVPVWRWLVLVLAVTAQGAVGSVSAQAQTPEVKHSYVPPNGFVPDSLTAVRIAEAVLRPIYSAEVLDRERPFQATLSGGTWTVEGTMPHAPSGKDYVGGVAVVEISKTDGRILRVSHGR